MTTLFHTTQMPMEDILPSEEVFSSVCLNNFIAFSTIPLGADDITSDKLKELATKHTEQMLAKIYKLPSEKSDEGRLYIVPKHQEILVPRQRKLPAVKPQTRWEKFAREQGIEKRKRSRLLWDETTKDWVPRWGMGSAKKLRQKAEEAIIEMKPHESLSKVIESRRAEGRLGKKKQEFREVRNKVEAAGGRLSRYTQPTSSIALLGKEHQKRGKQTLEDVNRRAAISTASFGIHDKKPVVAQKTGPKRALKRVATKSKQSGSKKRRS